MNETQTQKPKPETPPLKTAETQTLTGADRSDKADASRRQGETWLGEEYETGEVRPTPENETPQDRITRWAQDNKLQAALCKARQVARPR